MNKETLLKVAIIILAVALFFGVLLALLIPLQQKPPNEQTRNPKPTPAASRTSKNSTVQPKPSLIPVDAAEPTQLTKKDLIKLTPVTEHGFDIEYFLESDSFLITITESPYKDNKQKALDWFNTHGLDIDSLKILWSSYRYVN